MSVDPLEAISGKKKDPYAQYKAMLASGQSFGSKGPSQERQEVNTNKNTTFENSNDRLNTHAVSNAEAGAGGAAASIKAAGQAENSFGQGGSNQNMGGNGQGDTARINRMLQAREGLNPTLVTFGEVSQEDRQLNTLRNSVLEQYKTRFGIEPSPAIREALNTLDTPGELQSALRVMASQTRLPEEDSSALRETFLSSTGDSFENIG